MASTASTTSATTAATTSANARLGDRVWLDLNGNGLQDAGEPGFAGLGLSLVTAEGVVQATATTDAEGRYQFDVPAGLYDLLLYRPAGGWLPSPAQQGSDPALDSDLNADGVVTGLLLAAGSVRSDLDLGLLRLPTVGDRVWEDLNRNGRLDAGEPGVAGVVVVLRDASGAGVASAVTDSLGHYQIDQVVPGRYELTMTAPAGMAWTTQTGGGSVVDAAGRTGLHTVVAGDDLLVADAGLVRLAPSELATLGDLVFFDSNHNGLQDSGEAGMANVTVQLYDASGQWLPAYTTTTDASGHWSMAVPAGVYKLQFVPNTAVVATLALQGLDPTLDSNVTTSNGFTDLFVVRAGMDKLDLDAGAWRAPEVPQAATVGGVVFHDANADGLRADGERGILGAKLELLAFSRTDVNGAPVVVATTYSDANGQYSFSLPLTSAEASRVFYAVRASGAAGWVATLKDQGTDENRDSDVQANGVSDLFPLEPGGGRDHLDVGAYRPVVATAVADAGKAAAPSAAAEGAPADAVASGLPSLSALVADDAALDLLLAQAGLPAGPGLAGVGMAAADGAQAQAGLALTAALPGLLSTEQLLLAAA